MVGRIWGGGWSVWKVVGVYVEVGVGEIGGRDVVLWRKSGQKWPKPVFAEKSI